MRDKHRLREWARTQPPPSEVETARVVDGLATWMRRHGPQVVLTYLAMPAELDLTPVVGSMRETSWCVTRTPSQGWLTVHPYASSRELHRYGFEQPVAGSPEVDTDTVDLVLVPGLAFDRIGGRLGHGAGYYDELLGRMDHADLIGVTLERLVVPRLPQEPHDRRVGWLATEEGVRRCVR